MDKETLIALLREDIKTCKRRKANAVRRDHHAQAMVYAGRINQAERTLVLLEYQPEKADAAIVR